MNKDYWEQSDDFKKLFNKWSGKVYGYALAKTTSEYIAEETVQRVFLKLWHNLSQKQVSIPVESQLFQITKTMVLDIVKEEYSRNRTLSTMLNESDRRAGVLTPAERYQYKELKAQLEIAIARMPDKRKKVFILSRVENLSYKEIADRLALSPKTVENHIVLAIKFIKRYIS